MSDWVPPTPLETVVDMLEEVVDTGFDEDVIGWGSSMHQLDREELSRCINDEESFDKLVVALRPNILAWLKRSLEEDERFRNE
jgi:hypothetical protein